MPARDYSPADKLIMGAQRAFETLALPRARPAPQHPGAAAPEPALSEAARRHAAGLMRVNHAGEIAAQALYRGQALVARDPAVRQHLLKAAEEERAHLEWCETRLAELGDRPSRLGPLWYAASVAIGAGAGLLGDRASLGFIEETERQVSEHLDEHMAKLPPQDDRSRAILEKMREDEQRHGNEAAAAGGLRPPPPLRRLMAAVSRVMKVGAYRL